MKQSRIKSIFPNGNGYLICRLKNNKLIPLHKYIFQEINGKVPKGCEIHHDNGNVLDNTPENLICVTPEQHRKRHGKVKSLTYKERELYLIPNGQRDRCYICEKPTRYMDISFGCAVHPKCQETLVKDWVKAENTRMLKGKIKETLFQMRYHLLRITNPKRLREILIKYQPEQDYDLSDYIKSISC